jgi:hypothetical protein
MPIGRRQFIAMTTGLAGASLLTNTGSKFEDMSPARDSFMWHTVGEVGSWRA